MKMCPPENGSCAMWEIEIVSPWNKNVCHPPNESCVSPWEYIMPPSKTKYFFFG